MSERGHRACEIAHNHSTLSPHTHTHTLLTLLLIYKVLNDKHGCCLVTNGIDAEVVTTVYMWVSGTVDGYGISELY